MFNIGPAQVVSLVFAALVIAAVVRTIGRRRRRDPRAPRDVNDEPLSR
jgi:hypothetical protein